MDDVGVCIGIEAKIVNMKELEFVLLVAEVIGGVFGFQGEGQSECPDFGCTKFLELGKSLIKSKDRGTFNGGEVGTNKTASSAGGEGNGGRRTADGVGDARDVDSVHEVTSA